MPITFTNDRVRWLTASEAAELVDVNERTIRRWANAGKLRFMLQSYPGGYRMLVSERSMKKMSEASARLTKTESEGAS